MTTLRLVSPGRPAFATEAGCRYIEAKFVRRNQTEALDILRDALLGYGPAAAIVQLLAGVPGADRSAAESVLRLQGYGDGLTDRHLGSLLQMMNAAGIISYAKRRGAITVTARVAREEVVPSTVLITPKTPFANRIWLRRILEECTGFIYWLDKHFMASGLEPLWEAVDGSRISAVRILSLSLPDNSGPRVAKAYQSLIQDLALRSVSLEWRFIDSRRIKDDHDRWIIGASSARNVPNVNAIFSGQYSELNLSSSHQVLGSLFDSYWSQATEGPALQSIPSSAA